jgi:hypothetical protein
MLVPALQVRGLTNASAVRNAETRPDALLILVDDFRSQIADVKRKNEELSREITILKSKDVKIPDMPGMTATVIGLFLACWVLKSWRDAEVREKESAARCLEAQSKASYESATILVKALTSTAQPDNSKWANDLLQLKTRLAVLDQELRDFTALINKSAADIEKLYASSGRRQK